jgi:hypothetical protein
MPTGSTPAGPVVPGPITYVPAAYEPGHVPGATGLGAGQVGIVYPGGRSGRGVWVVLFLLVAAVAGFVGWRVVHTGSPAEPGVAYTSTEGHYSARFPEQPTVLTKTESAGHTKLVVHMAAVPGQGGVAAVEVSGPVTAVINKLADRFASDMGGSGDLALTGLHKFSFEGNAAQQGNYIDATTGQLMTVLEVARGERRMYVVIGLTGPVFDGLKGSFHFLP